jgi:thiamine-monophosphate kinase
MGWKIWSNLLKLRRSRTIPPVNTTLHDVGEQGLLKRLQRFCPPQFMGDDAALVQVDAGQQLVVTTDILIDGVHFSVGRESAICTTSPADVGWRSAAANLSDLAAMGAMPIGITVGLGLPSDILVEWVEQLYQGLTDCLAPYGTPIVGGDICRSRVMTVAIAAFGQVSEERAIRRSAARPGDVLIVTGPHGASRAGLELLLNPGFGKNLAEPQRSRLIQAHQRPTPRLDVLALLREIIPPSSPPPAGMDSSDGLADAIVQLCAASQVGAIVQRQRLPIPLEFHPWLSHQQALEWTLYGGEDFELVLAVPQAIAPHLVIRIPDAIAIGEITAGSEVLLVDEQGQFPPEALSLERGFQHF